jgi:dihydropyrimidine dehydrogenase (NAD+) subunit PreA
LENTFSYAAIDEDKCNGCGSCEKVGSCRAIKIIEKKAVVDKEKCEGCGLCKSICARQAISFIPW